MIIPFNVMNATGDAVLKRKELEYCLDSVLVAHVNPQNKQFFTDVVLHGSIVSLLQKIILVKSACKAARKGFDFTQTERVAVLLDVFLMRSHLWQQNGAYEDPFQGEFLDLPSLYNTLAPEYLKVEAALRELAKEI